MSPNGSDSGGSLADSAVSGASSLDRLSAAGLGLVSLLALTGNGLIVVAFTHNRRLREKCTNYFLVNLAVANLLVSLVSVPLRITFTLGYHVVTCKATVCLTITVCSGAVLTLAAISIDRYIGVTRPLLYQELVTSLRTCLAIGCVWIMASLVGFLPYMGWGVAPQVQDEEIRYCAFTEELGEQYLLFMSISTVFLPLAIMIFTYLRIFIESRKQARKIALLESMGDLRRRHSILQQREAKAAKRIALILGLYMVCELPVSLVDFVNFTCGNCVATAGQTVAVALAYCNAITSPLIYAKADAEFRQTFKMLIRKLRSKCLCECRKAEAT